MTTQMPGRISDAAWLAHRYDAEHDAVQFVHVPRTAHRSAVFLTDEYLIGIDHPLILARSDAIAAAPAVAPVHFVLHSAYCCSTMIAKAFDAPGHAMGLKEPQILNDVVGWRRRGGGGPDMATVLNDALTLLARPFEPGETLVIKPSNIVNGIASAMLTLRPEANALLLYAPLRTYLASIASKGLDGRLWARTLLLGFLDDRLIKLGFGTRDYVGHTDLQVAAVGWLAQQALFAKLVDQFGPRRVRTLNSETLAGQPRAAMARLSSLFQIGFDDRRLDAIVSGPAFTRHSKTGIAFASEDRTKDQCIAANTYADEIDKVARWAEVVAETFGVPMILPAALIEV